MGTQEAIGGRFLVFSQRSETVLDVQACDAQARRFFGLTLKGDADALVVCTPDGATSRRSVLGRATTTEDLALAMRAEALRGGGGLAGLATRCPTLWEVVRQDEKDVAALRIAAVLASLLLGPIVDAMGPGIFGVKTAREKLALAAESR